ncbi:MAG TPA: hypothetical protein VNC62_11055 [Burkholderiales bacterium]|jgi:hypothetical protein|nr:hypothetical protein [Burkholderiales bacterium]HVJ22715.1 hypothetical protein [Burkholderiales bacterium]
MSSSMVFRVMSLIPERTARVQSGSMFDTARVTAHPERIALITRFLGWLGPLDALTKEDQQLLGLRSSGGRPAEADGEEPLDMDDDEGLSDEDRTVRLPGAGTQIAA